ncbi:CatA-like O-acetyltransferase [Flavilitoribacter nigricans]|uniref:Chloramphenicol acetyltransferase n=1 Tax=Flavilitoribacter nigricans (strain ATCC 23147 / DSM 23189 / NBRC 102662 / NCIMB 1420 / SS-2) TaxID=1122177 RepID=A0A2D0NEG0_FLAN2|nr:CatA-like O-acetyltransferase [Flavilitoribacter nigricans]PHN06882.1 chloramphenicol acetyltransferase [Flavilitoribacter nigricans DSM 23189 = NBRC 102662]
MRKIVFEDAHRQKHFDFFRNMDQPHFNVCIQADISDTLDAIKKEGLHFTSTLVYLVSRAANSIPCFRQRIRGEEIVEHAAVHPSFTVQTQVSEVFSFCYVDYQPAYPQFVEAVRSAIDRMQEDPSFEDEAHRDDYLFLSSLPWLRFTGLTHAMHYSPVDSVPRITWGKFYKEGTISRIPLSVQVHHALVDGRNVGEFCELFEDLAANPADWAV